MLIVSFKKCVSRSLIKILGQPNQVNMCSNRKFVAMAAMQSLTSYSSAQRVRNFVVVIMYLTPIFL